MLIFKEVYSIHVGIIYMYIYTYIYTNINVNTNRNTCRIWLPANANELDKHVSTWYDTPIVSIFILIFKTKIPRFWFSSNLRIDIIEPPVPCRDVGFAVYTCIERLYRCI